MKTVLRVPRRDLLQITDSGGEVSQVDGGDAVAVERVGAVGTRRDRFLVALARASVLSLLEIQIAELFVIADGRILQDHRLEKADPLASAV